MRQLRGVSTHSTSVLKLPTAGELANPSCAAREASERVVDLGHLQAGGRSACDAPTTHAWPQQLAVIDERLGAKPGKLRGSSVEIERGVWAHFFGRSHFGRH